MTELVPAEASVLDQILDASHHIWNEGLTRAAYGRWYDAQLKTAWGRACLRRFALVERHDVLASAKLYHLAARLDGRAVRVAGLGAVFTQPSHRGRGHARAIVERLLGRASREGFELALLFSEIGAVYYERLGFTSVSIDDLSLRVAESPRSGAPATLIRSGESRDLLAIEAMGRARAAPSRFCLDRTADLIEYAIARKRLLAGLCSPGARELQFFVAEEGATAVAYVVVSVRGAAWVVEECGDRDPTGARVGAILQALLAREPGAPRPAIGAWLPAGFLPPQVTITARDPSAELMMYRGLSGTTPSLGADDVLYWRNDVF